VIYKIILTVSSAAFLHNYRTFYLRRMVTGSIHESHCVIQTNYSTVTDNYAVNSKFKRQA